MKIDDKNKNTQQDQADTDNRANQLNPNNDVYWQARGDDDRPDDWQDTEE